MKLFTHVSYPEDIFEEDLLIFEANKLYPVEVIYPQEGAFTIWNEASRDCYCLIKHCAYLAGDDWTLHTSEDLI